MSLNRVVAILEKSFTTHYAPMSCYVQALRSTMPDKTWQVVGGKLVIYQSGYAYLVHKIVLAEMLAELAAKDVSFTSYAPVYEKARVAATRIIDANWP